MIRRHDREEREWHDQTNKYGTNEPHEAATEQPRRNASKQAQDGQRGLHDRSASVAWSPNSYGSLRVATHSSGMLDEIDVDGGTREEGATQDRDELHYSKHVPFRFACALTPLAASLTPGYKPEVLRHSWVRWL